MKEVSYNEYYNYFGDNYKYYKEQYETGKIEKWNWAAFWLPLPWLIYRNLLHYAVIVCCIVLGVLCVNNQLEIYGIYHINAILYILPYCVLMILCGLFGNRLCIRQFSKTKDLNKAPLKNVSFKLKKTVVMVGAIAVMGLSLYFVPPGIKLLQYKIYNNTVLTVKDVKGTLAGVIFLPLPDGGTILIYRTRKTGDTKNMYVYMMKRKNNKIIFNKELAKNEMDRNYVVHDNSQFYLQKDTGELYLFLTLWGKSTIYKLTPGGEIIYEESAPAGYPSSVNFTQDRFEIKIDQPEEETEEDTVKTYTFDLQQKTWTEGSIEPKKPLFILPEKGTPPQKIGNSDLFYTLYSLDSGFFEKMDEVKDPKTKEVEVSEVQTILASEDNYNFSILDENKQVIMNFEVQFDLVYDYAHSHVLKAGDKIYLLFKKTYYVVDCNSKTIEKMDLKDFYLETIEPLDNGQVRLWGFTVTPIGYHLTAWQIDKNVRLKRKIFYRVGLLERGGFGLSWKYDNQGNIVLAGTNETTEIFIFKVDQKNRLVSRW